MSEHDTETVDETTDAAADDSVEAQPADLLPKGDAVVADDDQPEAIEQIDTDEAEALLPTGDADADGADDMNGRTRAVL